MYLFCQGELKSEKEIIFENTELGRLKKILPLSSLGELLPRKRTKVGAQRRFSREGLISLLFLQAYTQLSDRKFVDHLNGNWQMQMFCGIQLALNESIRDRNLMSRVRSYVSASLDLEEFQKLLLTHWKPHMKDTHVGMCDATVYESHMRYPTDVKLLWECCEYLQGQQQRVNKRLKEKHSSKHYDKKKRDYLHYARKRRKTYRQTKEMRKNLLKVVERLKKKLQPKLDRYMLQASLQERLAMEIVFEKLRTIKEIAVQQHYLLAHPDSKISNRIVSLYKPYVRPIVRGKETKAVEFGAKVHMLQIDGINYIEHFSYRAFNECTRLKLSVIKHKNLFGQCHQWSADAIYATNKNRKYLTSKKITSNFVPKGRPKDDPEEKTIKSLLNKERSTRLEGSFGTEKNYYGLSKVKARNQYTEKLSIYVAVMTANAVRLNRRIAKEQPSQLQQAA